MCDYGYKNEVKKTTPLRYERAAVAIANLEKHCVTMSTRIFVTAVLLLLNFTSKSLSNDNDWSNRHIKCTKNGATRLVILCASRGDIQQCGSTTFPQNSECMNLSSSLRGNVNISAQALSST